MVESHTQSSTILDAMWPTGTVNQPTCCVDTDAAPKSIRNLVHDST